MVAGFERIPRLTGDLTMQKERLILIPYFATDRYPIRRVKALPRLTRRRLPSRPSGERTRPDRTAIVNETECEERTAAWPWRTIGDTVSSASLSCA